MGFLVFRLCTLVVRSIFVFFFFIPFFFAPFFFACVLRSGRPVCGPACLLCVSFSDCSGRGFFGCPTGGYFGFFLDCSFVADFGGVARDQFVDR